MKSCAFLEQLDQHAIPSGFWDRQPQATLDRLRCLFVTGVLFAASIYGSILKSWEPMFTGFVLASIPLVVLFLFNMHHFIAGLTSGAIKA